MISIVYSSLSIVFLVTLSLNTSLHTHAQTLSLLALQRATPNLPLKLISPGRTLLKRGSLYQVERGSAPMQREFLLFSDCLLWLAPIESHSWDWDWDWSWSGSGSGISQSTQNSAGTTESKTSTTDMMRTRSKSEAEISSLKDDDLGSVVSSSPVSPQKSDRRKSHYHAVPLAPPNMVKKHGSNDDKFVYKGRVELVDLEVVVSSALEDERRFEVLSPEGSFVVYAGKIYLFVCFYIFFKKIDNHFSHRRRKRRLDFRDQRSQDSIICFTKRDQSQFDLDLFNVYKPHPSVFASPSFPTIR